MATVWPITVGTIPPFADHPDRACTGIPTDQFFPPPSGRGLAAKRVCARCPLADDCLRWALDNDEEGVWGGTTTAERAAIRKRGGMRRPHHPATQARRAHVHELAAAGWSTGVIAERLGVPAHMVTRDRKAAA